MPANWLWTALAPTEWVAWITYAVFSAVTLMIVGRDRCRRRLTLSPSKEEEALRAMEADRRLTPEDVRTLIDECAALPEVRETTPIPDGPLRLASAFARVYAGVHGLYLFFAFVTLAVAWIKARQPELGGVLTVDREGPTALILGMFLLMLGWPAMLFVAARRTLGGSLRARNWTVGLWVVCLAVFRYQFVETNEWLAQGPMWAVGVWSIWVMLLRPDASRKISFERPEPPRRRKLIWSAVLVAALAVGLPLFQLRLKHDFTYTSFFTTTNSGTPKSNGGERRLSKLYVAAISPDPTVYAIASALAAKFGAEMNTPAEALSFGTPLPPVFDYKTDLCLLVRDGRTPPEPSRPSIPGLPTGLSLEAIPGKAVPGTMKAPRPGPNLPGYRFNLLHTGRIISTTRGGLNFPDLGASFDATVVVAACPRRLLGEKVAEEVGKSLFKVLAPVCADTALVVPAWPNPVRKEADPEELDFPDLTDAFAVFRGDYSTFEPLDVWVFKKGEYAADLERIAGRLESLGYSRESYGVAGGIIEFSHGDAKIRLDMGYPPPEPNESRFYYDETIQTSQGVIVRSRWRQATKTEREPDLAVIADLRKNNLRTLLMANGLKHLEPSDRAVALREWFALPNLTTEHKLQALKSVRQLKNRDAALDECFVDLFRATASARIPERYDPADPEKRPGEVLDFFDLLVYPDLADTRRWLIKRLGTRYVRVDAPAAPDPENGLLRVTADMRIREALDGPLFVEIAFPRMESIWHGFSIWPATEAPDRYHVAANLSTSVGGSGHTRENATLAEAVEACVFSAKGEITGMYAGNGARHDTKFHFSQWGGYATPKGQRVPEPGKATLYVDADEKKESFQLEFIHNTNPGEKPKEPEIVP